MHVQRPLAAQHTPPAAQPTAAKPADAPKVGAVRAGIADGIRAVGNGYNQGAEQLGVASDKMYIYPVETAYAAGAAVKKVAPGPVKKAAGVFNVLGFLSAFHGMIIGGILRSPGDVVRDTTHAIADRIDGKQTLNGSFGTVVPGQGTLPPATTKN